jgi:beta-hydroxylase
MNTLIVIFSLYLASLAFVRLRNRESFPLIRQLSDFSVFMVPFNIPAYLLSKVPTSPFIETRHFPELKVIEDNWQDIRDEAAALFENGMITIHDDLPASSFYKDNRWTSFYLKSFDNDIPSAYELAPRTMALIDQVPNMKMALFACLNPGKTINGHHDPFAFTLRYSLGLITPNSEQSGIAINGQHVAWRDGESVLFDETYFHYAYNHTDKPRIILMTDIERPLRFYWLQRLYNGFGGFFNSLFRIDNTDATKTGIGNRLGIYLNHYKAFMKRFKRWNKPLYVTTKFVLLGGLIYLIFF